MDGESASNAWREDRILGRRVRIAPRRGERPNDFGASGRAARCPFCAGSEAETPAEVDRIEGADGGWLTRAVPNLYPALDGDDGAQEVVIESPRHATRFVDLTPAEATAAVRMWARRLARWRADPRFDYQLVFKNEGPAAGATLAHVHSQVVALPERPERAVAAEAVDRSDERRVVAREGGLLALCPPAPRCGFETWIVADDAPSDFAACSPAESEALARLLHAVLRAIERADALNAFNLVVEAPEGRPWRIEVAPRSAAIAGFELATGLWINPLAPERAAERLRTVLGD